MSDIVTGYPVQKQKLVAAIFLENDGELRAGKSGRRAVPG
jgi:hypothetical protein